MTSFIKTVYLCPTEGVVPKEVSHTHTYKLRVETDGSIILHVRNDGYLCKATEYYIYNTSKSAIIKKVTESKELTERLNGDIRELVDEMPDEFIETMAFIIGYDDKTLYQVFKDVHIKITDLEADVRGSYRIGSIYNGLREYINGSPKMAVWVEYAFGSFDVFYIDDNCTLIN
ncbi:MAG: hypothetical protein ABI185_00335 [Ginsengibacter sp.]